MGGTPRGPVCLVSQCCEDSQRHSVGVIWGTYRLFDWIGMIFSLDRRGENWFYNWKFFFM